MSEEKVWNDTTIVVPLISNDISVRTVYWDNKALEFVTPPAICVSSEMSGFERNVTLLADCTAFKCHIELTQEREKVVVRVVCLKINKCEEIVVRAVCSKIDEHKKGTSEL